MKRVGNTVLSRIGTGFLYLMLFLFAFLFTFPFYYVFILASYDTIYISGNGIPALWFGTDFIENVRALFTQLPFLRNFLTSAGIAILSTGLTIFFCTMGGFAFSKYHFKGKKAILAFVMATMAIPSFLNIIPFFKMMVFFRWYQTWLPLIVPGMANAFGIFLMMQFLESSVPLDLMDAARIDGLSEFQILLRVVFPLAKPAISVLGTVVFVGSWNNFLGALVMLPDPQRSTIPVALSSLFVRSDGNYGGMMAGTALALLPLLIVFIFFSKRIIANLMAGSLKG